MIQWVRQSMDRRRDEAGFTLVELVVAMVVTLIVMSALLGVFVQGIGTVSQSKQRQAATGLATQVMEQLRAQPYDDVTQPDGTVPPSDPNIVSGRFKPAALPGVDEELVVNALSPSVQVVQPEGGRDSANYKVRRYVTRPPVGTHGEQAFNVTVIVEWSSNTSRGMRTTIERSTLYSADGCLSTATRPFSGPCQAYFTSLAGQAAAGFTVTGSGAGDIAGLNGSKLVLGLPVLSTNLLLEQTTSASSNVATTDGIRSRSSGDDTIGGRPATVAVDSDPSSTANQTQSLATPTQTFSPALSLTGDAGTLSVRPLGADTGNAAAAVAAEPTLCRSTDDTELTTGPITLRRPCASARIQPLGSAGEVTFTTPGVGGLTFSVASLLAAPAPWRAVATHLAAANTGVCATGPGVTGIGCAHAAATRALGNVVVGNLPSGGGVAAGFAGAWRVTSLEETAKAEAGAGAAAPTYTRTGQLSYWNGSGYTPVVLSASTSGDYAPVEVTGTWVVNGAPLRITVTSTVTVQGATMSSEGPGDCEADACVVTSGAVGGIRGMTTYTLSSPDSDPDDDVITEFTVVADLSGLLTRSTYKAAPDA